MERGQIRGRGRGRGLGRGRGRGMGRGSGGSDNEVSRDSFLSSSDGSELYFPRSQKIVGDVSILQEFQKNFKCFGGYSEDEDQNFWNDNSCLTFLNTEYLPTDSSKEMTVNMDLNEAEKESKPYTGNLQKSVENYLSWISSNKEDRSAEFFSSGEKIICMKNVLSKILKIPYGYPVMYKFYAVHLDGLTYILNDKSKESQNYQDAEKISNWGHKFEQFMTYGENVKRGVIANLDYRCVLNSKIGSHNIFYSASLDCVNPDLFAGSLEDMSSTVTFKCIFDNPNDEKKYLQRFKMFDWYLGLVMVGTPEVLVGYRDRDGIVKRLKLYSRDDLAREGKQFWDFNISITFLDKMLTFVKERTQSSPGTVFSFTKPERTSYVKTEAENMDFPPSWFTDEFKNSVK